MADSGDRVVATNRRARREFDLLDTWEAGLVLRGSEVKSLRESTVQIAESFVRSEGRELWLVGLHVAPYSGTGRPASGHDPDRSKKLLLHRTEISRIVGRMDREGLTVVPLRLYFSKGRAKVEIALARGRRLRDQRLELAEREAKREAERAIARRRRR